MKMDLLDLQWGFNNIQVREGDEPKAAFITPEGLYEPLIMQCAMPHQPSSGWSTMS
jgi:hypothetical protein